MNVLHIINGLGVGGAESVLFNLCTNDDLNQHSVISLTGPGEYSDLLAAHRIKVSCINIKSFSSLPTNFYRLIKLIRGHKPDLVQTWMFHSDFVGGIAARVAGVKTVCWGIRNGLQLPTLNLPNKILAGFVLPFLSYYLPSKIVVCSQDVLEKSKFLGFDSRKLAYIPNGYDVSIFSPKVEFLDSLRSSLSLDPSDFLIGNIARFHSHKDHFNLLKALSSLVSSGLPFRCLLVGKDMSSQNQILVRWIRDLHLEDYVLLLGQRSDVSTILNLLDLHVMSSKSEGFPNVVSQSMACGTPCVVTDVGDSSLIVGDTGWVVPPSNSTSLASAISDAYLVLKDQNTKQLLGNLCRERILANYTIRNMINSYHDTWLEALQFN